MNDASSIPQHRTRRSDSTRARILRAAREGFAADGYDRATVRRIAADARIDPSVVMHYFGSKAELFAAAIDVDLQLPDLMSVPADQRGIALVTHFLDRWDGATTADVSMTLLKSLAEEQLAVQRAQQMLHDQLVPGSSGAGERNPALTP